MVDRRLELQISLVSVLQSLTWLGRNFDTIDALQEFIMPEGAKASDFTYVLSDKNHENQCCMYVVTEDPTMHNLAFRYTSDRVYFQPPETRRMAYPCILYSFSGMNTVHADNHIYYGNNVYQLILVDENPDSVYVTKLLRSFEGIKIDRFYISDSLNHWVFALNY